MPPFAPIDTLAEEQDLEVSRVLPPKREMRYRTGLQIVQGRLSLVAKRPDAASVLRALVAVEEVPGLSIEDLDWDGGSTLRLTLKRKHRLWPSN